MTSPPPIPEQATNPGTPGAASVAPAFLGDLRAAVTLLEQIVADRALLAHIPADHRRRLLQAAGHVYAPDALARRQLVRATTRRRKAEQVEARGAGPRAHRASARSAASRYSPVPTSFRRSRPSFAAAGRARDPDAPREPLDRSTATSASASSPISTTSTTSSAPRAPRSTSPSAPSWPICAARVALLTGGRVKIGYQAGLKLLRAGARLDRHHPLPPRLRRSLRAASRTSPTGATGSRSSASTCGTRRASRRSATSCSTTRDRLDFIVNNACQTVRRPPDFYAHMMAAERDAAATLSGPARALLGHYEEWRGTHPAPESLTNVGPAAFDRRLPSLAGIANAAELSQVPSCRASTTSRRELFPEGRLDPDGQQVDLRERNSWRMLLADVPSVELLEVQLVNAVAPFILNARLKPLMLRTPGRAKHIVNVSAMEGQFYRNFKTTRHPHTNMAKAALNMMTRTAAADYEQDGIHMNAVDTGWVTDEDPAEIARAEGGGAPLPSAARHRRRRGADRGPDHRRGEHRRARLGQVPQGLSADGLVTLGPAAFLMARPSGLRAFLPVSVYLVDKRGTGPHIRCPRPRQIASPPPRMSASACTPGGRMLVTSLIARGRGALVAFGTLVGLLAAPREAFGQG